MRCIFPDRHAVYLLVVGFSSRVHFHASVARDQAVAPEVAVTRRLGEEARVWLCQIGTAQKKQDYGCDGDPEQSVRKDFARDLMSCEQKSYCSCKYNLQPF